MPGACPAPAMALRSVVFVAVLLSGCSALDRAPPAASSDASARSSTPPSAWVPSTIPELPPRLVVNGSARPFADANPAELTAPPYVESVDGWTLRAWPAEIVGRPGEVIEVVVEVTGPDNDGYVWASVPWLAKQPDVPRSGELLRYDLVIAEPGRFGLVVRPWQDGRFPARTFEGTPIRWPEAIQVAREPLALEDLANASDGLRASRASGEVTVEFASDGENHGFPETIRGAADLLVVDDGMGGVRAALFVRRHVPDAVILEHGNPFAGQAHRLSASLNATAALEVVAFVATTCECTPYLVGYAAHLPSARGG